MLRKNSVSPPLLNLLLDLQANPLFADYFLVGGTALALQLGHRMSVDIDLFTKGDINKDEIRDFFNEEYRGRYLIVNTQNTILQISVDDIKVDFVKHNYDLIENIKSEDGIRYLGLKDIAAMKLMAVANRGDQAKDFIDIYFLLKHIPLRDMFEYYKKKYNQSDVCMIKRSLIYFDDVDECSWAAVNFLTDKISAEEVKRVIVEAVECYHKEGGEN